MDKNLIRRDWFVLRQMRLWGLLDSNPNGVHTELLTSLLNGNLKTRYPDLYLWWRCVGAWALTFTCVKVTRFKSNANKSCAFVH